MNTEKIRSMKGKEKIAVLTCYDYSFAKAIDSLVDMILVGDSLANVVYGYETTKEVSMLDMTRHVAAVARGAKNTIIVADMPFRSDSNESIAVINAKQFFANGAHAVKVEGKPNIVRAISAAGIPVMGHVGMLPQTSEKRLYGKTQEEAEKIIEEAKSIESAGAFCIVIESVPSELAKKITGSIKIPTIGIGAGPYCDGQVLVSYDMLGLFENPPKFVKRYADLGSEIKKAVTTYSKEVKGREFPN